MNRLIFIHEVAEIEINEAANFYDLKCPGLSKDFIDEIQKAINTIAEFPDATPIIKGKIRKKTLLKFPYSLFYSVRKDSIRILAIAHQKRRPFYWSSRI